MNILMFLLWLIESGSWVAGIYILSENKLSKTVTVLLSISFIPVFLIRFFFPATNEISNFSTFLLFLLYFLLVNYKIKNVIKSIFICSIPISIKMGASFLIELLLWLIYDVNSIQESASFFIITLVELVLSTVIVIVGVLFTRVLMRRYAIDHLLEGQYGFLFTLFPILGMVIFSFNFYFVKNMNFIEDNSIKGNIVLFTLFSLVLVSVMLILFKVIFTNLKVESERIQNQQLNLYMKELEKQNDEIRKIRHDYVNIMTTMSGYLENEDIQGLKKYFSEKIIPLGEKIETNDAQLGRLAYIKVSEVKAIVAAKLLQAQKSNIRLIVDIVDPIENFHMDTLNLSRALGIILDNAIEAAQESEFPQIDVSFIEKNHEHFILIKNSYCDKPPIHLIFTQGFSTKGENRGLGLSNLRELFNECKNVSLNTHIDDENKYFFQEILITY